MARQSFRLRRTTGAGDAVGVGSFVRGTDADQAMAGASIFDQDSAIRSTGIITIAQTADVSTFQASAIQYNAVFLNWVLSEAFTTVADIGSGESGLVGVVLVYSKTGAPETVVDGQVIFSGSENSYLHQNSTPYTSNNETLFLLEPESGKWSYYTLFGYYNTDGVNGSYFYERLASLEVIVPKNYGSTDDLWSRIPAYYRELDLGNGGQLYKYVSVFGFEVDRIKTLIDNVMVQYDPLTAETQSIEQLSQMVGLELAPSDIGTSKTRALLYDVGYLRKSKGTIQGVRDYLTAVSGSEVDIIYNGASAAPYYTIRVHSERANLVADPRFINTDNSTWQVYSQNGASVGTSPSEGITVTAGASGDKVAIVCKVDVPMSGTNNYYMSAEFNQYPLKVFGGVWSNAASWSDWSATDSAASISVGVTGRYAYQMENSASGEKYPVFLFELGANQAVTISRWMVEPNRAGSFFDGDSVFGGFLYQNFTSDYTWSGVRFGSYSRYTTNRKKTFDAIERLLPQILPVTLLGEVGGQPKYDLYFNWIPGRTS